MEQIKELFSTIKDARHDGYVKHLLSDVLILVMGAVICGMIELADMMVYFNKKIKFYNERFGISIMKRTCICVRND